MRKLQKITMKDIVNPLNDREMKMVRGGSGYENGGSSGYCFVRCDGDEDGTDTSDCSLATVISICGGSEQRPPRATCAGPASSCS